jgi:hypothetical protein
MRVVGWPVAVKFEANGEVGMLNFLSFMGWYYDAVRGGEA